MSLLQSEGQERARRRREKSRKILQPFAWYKNALPQYLVARRGPKTNALSRHEKDPLVASCTYTSECARKQERSIWGHLLSGSVLKRGNTRTNFVCLKTVW